MATPSLAFRLESIVNLYRARYLKELSALGLGPGQERILEFVLENPGIRQSVIVHTLQLHKSVVSRSLKTLERYRYVVRTNRRVRATPLARALRSLRARFVRELEESLVRGFDEKETRDLVAYLRRVEINLVCRPGETDLMAPAPGSFGAGTWIQG